MRAWLRGAAAAALAFGVGCGDDSTEGGEGPLFTSGVNSLTVILYDAMSGAGVTDASVSVRVGRHSLAAARTDNIYTVDGVPAGTFPVFIDAPGFLEFAGKHSFHGSGRLTDPNQPRQFYTATALMYPKQAAESDVTVKVYERDGGAPVSSGRVVATIDPNIALRGIVNEVSDVLQGTLGLRPSSIDVDLAGGTAVLPKEQLVFGATYRIDVFAARNGNGDYLQPVEAASIQIGEDFPSVVVFMGPPATTPIAVSANNEDDEDTVSNLTVAFPYPIEVCSDPEAHTWMNYSGDTDGDGTSAQPDPDGAVVVSLSEGNSVLTLTPGIDPVTDDMGDTLTLGFGNVGIRVVGTRGTDWTDCLQLGGVPLRDSGDSVSTVITVRRP